MRNAILVVALVLAIHVPAARAQQTFQFFVSVVDAKGAPVTTLTPADIAVREGGADGKVLKLDPIDWPMKVQVLIDNGTGVGSESLQYLRTGVRGLFDALPEGVEASLVTTAPQPRTVVKPTTDRQMLLQGAERITPDSGAARFSEALVEAFDRVDKDKSNAFPVVVIVGSTAAEASRLMDRDFQKLLQRIQQHAATVHVVMLSSTAQAASNVSGEVQTQVGTAVSKQSGGRYEAIAAPSRIATLLPEIGKQIAASNARQTRQYRVTFQRPDGKSGQVSAIEMAVPNGMTAALSLDGHLP